jgi:hypothetical protein
MQMTWNDVTVAQSNCAIDPHRPIPLSRYAGLAFGIVVESLFS